MLKKQITRKITWKLTIKPRKRDDWEDVLLVGEVLPWLSPLGWYCQKIMQFGISVFLEVQKGNF